MNLAADIHELLGTRKRPLKPVFDDEEVSLKTTDLHQVLGGVSIPWLCKAFRMGRSKVEQALRTCRPISTTSNGALLYDLPTAASFLVKPRTDFEAYLKTLKAEDLPEQLREGFWSAKLKEQKWKLNAGDLWPTGSVLEVLGETFKTIKTTTQLWADTLTDSVGLTDRQRLVFTRLVDDLLDELHKALIAQARQRATGSQLEQDDASELA